MIVLVSVVMLVLVVGALADLITRPDDRVKHLPKLVWVMIILFLPLVGSVLWFAVGRDYARSGPAVSFGDPRRWEKPRSVDRPASPPRSTEDELAAIEAEIAHHENLARIRRLEAEIDDRRRRSLDG